MAARAAAPWRASWRSLGRGIRSWTANKNRDGREETTMKDLIKQYLDQGISRRKLMSRLSAAGFSTVAAKAMAQSLAPVAAPAKAATPARCAR